MPARLRLRPPRQHLPTGLQLLCLLPMDHSIQIPQLFRHLLQAAELQAELLQRRWQVLPASLKEVAAKVEL